MVVTVILWDMMLCALLGFCFLLGILFETEDGGMFLHNVDEHRLGYTASLPGGQVLFKVNL